MPRSKNSSPAVAAPSAFTHDSSTRTGLPAGGTAGKAPVPKAPKKKYWYNPHLSPVLRHDSTGQADRILALVQKAGREPLSQDEQKLLQEALRTHQPWLEWSGKREAEEKGYFEVDPVALSIHERVSPQAILRAAKREDIQRDLFADPQESWTEAVKFYRHDVEWANRMILGDSLQVMTSLAERENLAGKVQMIYIDPPYGIKFASNFQPETKTRELKEKEEDFSRDQEMVRAYRDTWELGKHSYIEYLKRRLQSAHVLLHESGSIFIQISDTNVHLVRSILDETFGDLNFVSQISYKTTQNAGANTLDTACDYIVWYCRNIEKLKFRNLVKVLERGDKGATRYNFIENLQTGECNRSVEDGTNPLPDIASIRFFTDQGMTSRGLGSENTMSGVPFQGERYFPPAGHWRTTVDNITKRLMPAERIIKAGKNIRFKKCFEDFGCLSLSNLWDDVAGGISSRDDPKVFVVQTSRTIIERCLLMTTDPGDLVLDPTCGSGTTAYVAEQWGRRWITIDTSRVALAIARQRLMTARFENYQVRKPSGGTAENPGTGFIYKTVPHITLKSIAQNRNLDPIFDKHEPLLDAALMACNKALATVDKGLKARLQARLAAKQSAEGKRAISDADTRRWQLKEAWEHWEVPFDTDPDWPAALQTAVTEYRKRWRAKMDEVNACIAANADQEELVDQPQGTTGVRVSGPFTVEGVLPVEYTREAARTAPELAADSGSAAGLMLTIDPAPAYGSSNDTTESDLDEDAGRNAEAYYDNMLRLLRLDGVTFKGNVVKKFARLEALWSEGRDLPWQAEGWWEGEDQGLPASVAVIFGPQYGPLTAMVLEEALQAAPRSGYTELVCAAFSFEPELTEIVADEASHTRLRIHQAFIRPDVNPGMDGLLKDQAKSQLFTVFGKPEIRLDHQKDGSWTVTLEGVDIYDPLTGDVHSTGAGKVAAWFLDADYDGRAFCITQAFFPDQDAWEKIRKALKTEAEDYAFDAYKGTVSVPFKTGKFGRIAVKVIDPRGNEVMVVKKLEGR